MSKENTFYGTHHTKVRANGANTKETKERTKLMTSCEHNGISGEREKHNRLEVVGVYV